MGKLILDACCGPKMFWLDKHHKDTVYVDKRFVEHQTIWMSKKNNQNVCKIDVMPDIVADFRALPFADESFWHVVFDPPHLVRAGQNSYMKHKYGSLPKDWKDCLRKGFDECWRVTKVNGSVVFKWSAVQIPVSKVIDAIGRTPLYANRCGKSAKTHWMFFFKEAK